MTVHVFAVGRVRDPAIRAACEDYAKRARRFFPLQVREVADAGRAGSTAAVARRLEGQRLRDALPRACVTVALTRPGMPLSSDALAKRVAGWRDGGREVAFLVGGPFGLADDLIADSALALSLSTMTLPHELARLILLEQIYRAGTILKGTPYHKRRAP
jgi:23S rRNA (pseudouridine1915-N3)-methyltransferase